MKNDLPDITISKARSILANSCPEILIPKRGKNGIFQIKWVVEIDAHVLFYKRNVDGCVLTLASHWPNVLFQEISNLQ